MPYLTLPYLISYYMMLHYTTSCYTVRRAAAGVRREEAAREGEEVPQGHLSLTCLIIVCVVIHC